MTPVSRVDDHADDSAAIRPLVRRDIDRVRALFADGHLSVAEGSPPHIRRAVERYAEQSLADDLADIWAHYMKPPGSHFWVAEAGGDIIGIVGIEPAESGSEEVRRMAVARQARRRGLAQRLLHTAEEWAKTHGYVAMGATTTHLQSPAQALYVSAGYRECGAGTWGPLKLIHFHKRLVDAADAGGREE